jgi:hypothetical protein
MSKQSLGHGSAKEFDNPLSIAESTSFEAVQPTPKTNIERWLAIRCNET